MSGKCKRKVKRSEPVPRHKKSKQERSKHHKDDSKRPLYTTISGRLRTVSWSDYCRPSKATYVVYRFHTSEFVSHISLRNAISSVFSLVDTPEKAWLIMTQSRGKRSDLVLWQFDKNPYTNRKLQKGKWQHKKPPKTSIKQRLETDLGWPVEVKTATPLMRGSREGDQGSGPPPPPPEICQRWGSCVEDWWVGEGVQRSARQYHT